MTWPMISGRVPPQLARAEPVRDIQELRGFVTSPLFLALLDAPWSVIFLALIFMVQRVGIDDQPREQLGQRAQRCIVGDIGRGEQQRRFLAVQVGQFGLQLLVINRGAGDVAGAAGACAGRIDGIMPAMIADDPAAVDVGDMVISEPPRSRGYRGGCGGNLPDHRSLSAGAQVP